MQLLTEASPSANQPTNTNIVLKPHQLTLLSRCQQLEMCFIKVSETLEMQTHAGIIADKAGSGKSYVILSLIASGFTPAPSKKYMNYGSEMAVTLIHTAPNDHLHTSVIVSPHSLINQWKQCIAEFPSVRCYVLEKSKDYYDLPTSWSDYDLVLCSNTFHNRFVQYTDSNNIKFSRIFYDEADALNIPACYKMNAKFHWFVTSAYKNLCFPHGHQEYNQNIYRYITIAEGIRSSGYIRNFFSRLMYPSAAFQRIIVKNDDEFVDKSLGILEHVENVIMCRPPTLDSQRDKQMLKCLDADDIPAAIKIILPEQRQTEPNIISLCVTKLDRDIELFDQQMAMVTDTDPRYVLDSRRISAIALRKKETCEKINAIKDRVKAVDGCPVCYNLIEQKIVLPCCSNAFCIKCVGTWLSQNKSCPLCKAYASIKDMLLVDPNPKPVVDTSNLVHANNNKVRNLINLIKLDTQVKKILIFSEYEPVFNDVARLLDPRNTRYFFIKGNVLFQEAVLKMYHDPTKTVILFVSPTHLGRGLDLQNTTDIIFFDKFDNESEKQTIGRAQRLGRKNQLRVWYLVDKISSTNNNGELDP